jgi:hypothetical protein
MLGLVMAQGFKLVKKLVKTVTLMNRVLIKGDLTQDDDESDTGDTTKK